MPSLISNIPGLSNLISPWSQILGFTKTPGANKNINGKLLNFRLSKINPYYYDFLII